MCHAKKRKKKWRGAPKDAKKVETWENIPKNLYCSLFLVKATGEFTILSSPKSLLFKGNEPLPSSDVGDVIAASMGNSVAGDSKWPGLIIEDPFNPARGSIVCVLNGVASSKVASAGKTYKLDGNTVEQSLNGLSAQLEADNEPVCDINFEQFDEGVASFKNAIGDVEIPDITKTQYLNADLHEADKQYLESISYCNAIAENLATMQKSCIFVNIRLSVDGIAKAHGEQSEAVREAAQLYGKCIKDLNASAQKSSSNNALVVAIVNKADGINRSKREAALPDAKV